MARSSDENLHRFKRKMTKRFVMGIINESTVTACCKSGLVVRTSLYFVLLV